MKCPACKAPNPIGHRFCGQCGVGLAGAGTITLARSGLIARIDDQALALLGCRREEMAGKAFSLFVRRQDLVVFFTHWNKLLSQGTPQSFEIVLNHKARQPVAVHLDCTLQGTAPKDIEAVHLALIAGRLAAAPARPLPARATPRPMVVERFEGDPPGGRQTLVAGDDGLVPVTCSGCGFQETFSLKRLEKSGHLIRVACSCGNRFVALLEKRRFLRKRVCLEGYFSVGGDLGPMGADGTIWGPMAVQDLSKAGLRFTAQKSALLHPGDLLVVRFNLDNASKALIHKTARVVSATSRGVGCLFVGADRYDITLGFYLM